MKKRTEDQAIRSLSLKRDAQVIPSSRRIFILNEFARGKQDDLGNGSWGNIDSLSRMGYKVSWVAEFSGREGKQLNKRKTKRRDE